MNKINPNHGMGWNKPDELREQLRELFDEQVDYLKAHDPLVDKAMQLIAAHTAKAVARAETRGRYNLVEQMLGNREWNIPSEVPDRPLLTDRLLEILEEESVELEAKLTQFNAHHPAQENE